MTPHSPQPKGNHTATLCDAAQTNTSSTPEQCSKKYNKNLPQKGTLGPCLYADLFCIFRRSWVGTAAEALPSAGPSTVAGHMELMLYLSQSPCRPLCQQQIFQNHQSSPNCSTASLLLSYSMRSEAICAFCYDIHRNIQ